MKTNNFKKIIDLTQRELDKKQKHYNPLLGLGKTELILAWGKMNNIPVTDLSNKKQEKQ